MNKLRADIERFRSLNGQHDSLTALRLFWSCFNPRVAPVVLLRLAEYGERSGVWGLAKIFSMINVVVFGIEVSPKVEIGGGLFLPHTVGTVIGAERIGNDCTIMQGVTLGSAQPDMGFDPLTRPVIGNGVLIGAGAKVIGRVSVGDFAKIGANAVVLSDIPAHSVAVGVPARVVASDSGVQ